MSQAANRHKYWACPFFKWDAAKDVNCEGGKISFPTSEAANAYMNAYCANNPGWETCSVAKALYEFYEKQEDMNREKR